MSLFSFTLYLLERKRWIIGFPIICSLLAFFLAWALPPYYSTEIRLRVDDSDNGSFSSLVSASASKALGGFSSFLTSGTQLTPDDLYMEILDGRDVKIATIQKFKLDTLYKKASLDLLIKTFSRDFIVDVNDAGIISCSFESQNRELAKSILQFAVLNANNRYMRLQRERVKYSLSYLEASQKRMMDSVEIVSQDLIDFYRKNNLLDLKSQMELTFTTLAGYEEEINNYKLSEANQLAGNASALEMRKKRELLEREFEKLRGRYSETYKPSSKSVFVNSDWAVSKILEQEKYEAKLKYLMKLLEVVSAQLVAAEAEYIKNQPVIQIIQDAYIPDWKNRPKRATWAITAFALAWVFMAIFLLIQGVVSKEILCDDEIRNKFLLLAKGLRP